MAYWHLNTAQLSVVKRFVARRVVHDLGAGDLSLSSKLLELRAAAVIAVDREKYDPVGSGVRFVRSEYKDLQEVPRTAFVSWPPGVGTIGLVDVLKRTKTVLYLGNNFDGSLCGTTDLWEHLRTRRVLAHEPARRNTLIVYGSEISKRSPLPEEDAATDFRRIRRFELEYSNVESI